MLVTRSFQVFCSALLVCSIACGSSHGQEAFYTFTSGPGGDGFVWDFDSPPFGLNDLPSYETFLAPTDDGLGFINIENSTENTTFFDDNYLAAGNSPYISGEAWWGNPLDNSFPQLGVTFYNTTNGYADSVSFDFAWALASDDPGEVLEVEVYDSDFDTAILFFSLSDIFGAGPAYGNADGRTGRIAFDLLDAQNDNPDIDQIESIYINVSEIATLGGTGEFAIDNLRINGGDGGAENSNVIPYSSFSMAQIGGISTNRLRGSAFDTTVDFEVKNDGVDPTTFTAELDPSSSPEFVLDSPAINLPIGAGAVEDTGVVATLSSSELSGEYYAYVNIINDLNPTDPTESLPFTVEIYDPPSLTDNSGSTVQVDTAPTLSISNAPAGPHSDALRAGVKVTGLATTGPFAVGDIAIDDFVGPGEMLDGVATFDRFGRLSGVHNGDFTVELEMKSDTNSFLNGAEPVASVVWDLSYNLSDTPSDSTTLSASEGYAGQLGVNSSTLAATLVGGASPSAQTVSMALGANPESGAPSAILATETIDLLFGDSPGLFVLELTYDPANTPSGSAEKELRPLFYDQLAGDWVDAIDGNTGGASGESAFAGSYDEYLASLGGGALDMADLGAFGYDTANDRVWAVLNHASIFAVGVFATPSLPGDANGDGAVDILDLDILSGNFGTPTGATIAQGDFNGDGAVDILDLDILSGNFGSMASSHAIPEPAALLMAAAGAVFCLGTRRQTTD